MYVSFVVAVLLVVEVLLCVVFMAKKATVAKLSVQK